MTTKPENKELTIYAAIFAIVLSVLFGANAVAIKLTFQGIGVFTTAGLRFGIASIVVVVWIVSTGSSLRVEKKDRVHIALLSILFVFQFMAFYYGMGKTLASRSMLIANIQPFMVLFLSHFFIKGDPITIRKFIGIFCGFMGVVFVILDKGTLGKELLTGDLFVMIGTFFWACQMVYIKNIISKIQSWNIVAYPLIFSFPCLLIAGMLFDEKIIFNLNISVVGALLYQGLVTASFGMLAWNYLLKRYGAVSLHSFVFVMPVVGVVLGGMILKEPISSKILVALVSIVAGTIIINFNGIRKSI